MSLKWKILLITISACEARAGLALMTSLSRRHKTDLIKNFKLLQT